jgi:hypothetical protein
MTYRTLAWRPIALGIAGLALLGGCASSDGPEVLAIAPDAYDEAFDAAVEAARARGLAAALKDRRGGVIETDTAPAGSMFEPWRGESASWGQAVEHTAGFARRRARFEFAPPGVDAAGGESRTADLTNQSQALELRVLVTVERASRPGLRSSTWSQLRSSTTLIVPPGSDGQPLPGQHWVPLGRDEAFERRLLADVGRAMATTIEK